MLPHPSTNFEIQKHYQNEPKTNGVSLRHDLPKIQVEAYVINLDDYKSTGTHWIKLHMNRDNETYFDSFRVEYLPREVKTFIGNKNIAKNVYRIKTNDSIMSGYFRIGFIDFMQKGEILLDYSNLFSPNEYEKDDKMILKYFLETKNFFYE